MRKVAIVLLAVLLLFAGVEQDINYIIKHQKELKFESLKLNSSGWLELRVPAESVGKLFAAKKELGAKEIQAVPAGDSWKVVIVYESQKPVTPLHRTGKDEKAGPEKLSREDIKNIRELKKKGAKPSVLSLRRVSVRESRGGKKAEKKAGKPRFSTASPSVKKKSEKTAENRVHAKKSETAVQEKASAPASPKDPAPSVPPRYQILRKEARKALLEKVTVSYKNLPLVAFLDMLADRLDVSIVSVGELPKVSITFFAKKTEFYKIVEAIFDVYGLAMIVESENLILVGQVSTILNLKKQKKAVAELQKTGPEKMVVLRTRNIKASEAAKILTDAVRDPFLKISFVNQTNTLILKGPEKLVDMAASTLKRIDRARSQIHISAKIVEVSSSETDKLGIRWTGYGTIPSGTAGFQGHISTSPRMPTPEGGVASADLKIPERNVSQSLRVGLPYNIAGLEIQLSALERRGKARTIAEPSIVLEEGQKGRLYQTREVPYTTVNSSWISSVSFKEAGLVLDVTPHIVDPQGKLIRLYIEMENSSVDFDKAVMGQPTILRQRMQVVNVMRDGEVRIIGGLKKEVSSRTREFIPLLSRIPFIGSLFKSRDARRDVMELIVFIKASVVKLNV